MEKSCGERSTLNPVSVDGGAVLNDGDGDHGAEVKYSMASTRISHFLNSTNDA